MVDITQSKAVKYYVSTIDIKSHHDRPKSFGSIHSPVLLLQGYLPFRPWEVVLQLDTGGLNTIIIFLEIKNLQRPETNTYQLPNETRQENMRFCESSTSLLVFVGNDILKICDASNWNRECVNNDE